MWRVHISFCIYIYINVEFGAQKSTQALGRIQESSNYWWNVIAVPRAFRLQPNLLYRPRKSKYIHENLRKSKNFFTRIVTTFIIRWRIELSRRRKKITALFLELFNFSQSKFNQINENKFFFFFTYFVRRKKFFIFEIIRE